MKEKIGYTEVAPGNKSANRLIYLIGMIWLMAVTTWLVYLKTYQKLEVSWVEISMLFGTVSGILVGSKLYQNSQEGKENPSINSPTS